MNSTATKKPALVEKEDISKLSFPKDEVLKDADKQKELKAALDKAMKLGNAYKGKVKIVFEDSEGVKAVETTIWGITDKNILLKQTTIIPIRRVLEIKF
ncbi:MAG TPA: hypothetical protein PK649_06930 [Vicingus sp.]|nr:hypothetical protein [Vicingus sp.]HRP59420.1 hypothetical protein [Vicingus sp.]